MKVLMSLLVFATAFGCKEIYKPTIISSANTYLVVEGVLNAAAGPTSIRLTRTFKLDDEAHLTSELNAQVLVEGKDNIIRPLTMTTEGFYTSPNLNLAIGQEYRLKITTAGGKEYLSDYVVARQTPAIDSLGFKQEEKGVQIYANTHDDLNNTRYYRWDYDETWEIRSYYYSSYKYVNGMVLERTAADDVSTCWKYDKSDRILLGSSASLQSDNIYRAPITFIENNDEKLVFRYSILLRQYALAKAEYQFYENIKKNTESLGSIFDAQPSEIRGNIHAVSDPGELVIGYVAAAEVEEKRFFISAFQLQGWRFFQDCPSGDIANHPDSIKVAYEGDLSIYAGIRSMFGNQIVRYNVARKHCVECPARGGSTIKPTYW